MKNDDLRTKYIDFFKKRGHSEIASASLYPENDPSVLFTTAGMHPLVTHLMGQPHPLGVRLTGIQKCFRTDDIDEVGDAFHLTFFEMLGNWSLGDYFKKESIEMSYTFLTEVLGIDPGRLAVTVFEGDGNAERDDEAFRCWRESGMQAERIFYYGKKENWWGPVGSSGPCGPDTEIFYITDAPPCSPGCGPACACGRYVELWNNVFLQCHSAANGVCTPLRQKNVDTGMGLERVRAVLEGKPSVYETDLFLPLLEETQSRTGLPVRNHPREIQILCDHIRAVTFLLGDPHAVAPSNTEQGYVIRRLIRRVLRILNRLGTAPDGLQKLCENVIVHYSGLYPELLQNKNAVLTHLEHETAVFGRTLQSGLKQAEKLFCGMQTGELVSGQEIFRLFDTFGFPPELTAELADEKGLRVDLRGFDETFKAHQQKSRQSAPGRFTGGLCDDTHRTVLLHTATHLLGGALRRILGSSISQKGSHITAERLRFDFSFERKLTDDEIRQIEAVVNEAIQKEIVVLCEEMSFEAAKASGALGVFDHKYGDIVRVYTIGEYSKEICGGPHASNTRELRSFRILKEESSSAGVRRIKATIG